MNETLLVDFTGLSIYDGLIKQLINTKYVLPDGGIPLEDLAEGVQTSLGKADSAVQDEPTSLDTIDIATVWNAVMNNNS